MLDLNSFTADDKPPYIVADSRGDVIGLASTMTVEQPQQ